MTLKHRCAICGETLIRPGDKPDVDGGYTARELFLPGKPAELRIFAHTSCVEAHPDWRPPETMAFVRERR